jgi:MYXO-CTERM domain-containing protein
MIESKTVFLNAAFTPISFATSVPMPMSDPSGVVPLYDSSVRLSSMTSGEASSPGREQIDRAERLLAERGRDLGIRRTRVAADRGGFAIGFPADPMIHVSWWALLVLALLTVLSRRARR